MIETKFKNTEIGPIPEDWEVVTLSDIASYGNTTAPTYLYDNKNYICTENMMSFRGGVVPYEGPVAAINVKNYAPGDILISNIRPYLQKIWLAKCMGGVSADVLVIRSDNEKVNDTFLYYILSQESFFSYVMEGASGTKMPRGNKKHIMNYSIYMPPSLNEQEAIGEALREVDELIEGLKKFVAKKRAIKQGAMSQLLTGKSRLPGFSEPWKEVTFEELGETFGGLSGKTKSDFNTGTAKYITFINVIRNIKIQPNLFEAVSVGVNEKQNKILKGDLLFNTSSETPEEVALCSVLTEDIDNLYLNSFCFGFRLKRKDVQPLFIAYFLRTDKGRKLMSKTAAGVTRFNVSKKKFLSTSINLPSLAEQEAIAKVLTDMDAEIEALSRKVAKYEQVKQGMMQQLLTGKIRLV